MSQKASVKLLHYYYIKLIGHTNIKSLNPNDTLAPLFIKEGKIGLELFEGNIGNDAAMESSFGCLALRFCLKFKVKVRIYKLYAEQDEGLYGHQHDKRSFLHLLIH